MRIDVLAVVERLLIDVAEKDQRIAVLTAARDEARLAQDRLVLAFETLRAANGQPLRSTRWRRGEGCSIAKLTSAKVLDIRRRARAGESVHGLASEYGVTVSTMAKAVRGDTWKHV